MGRQIGATIFLGTGGGLTGYVDEGVAYARLRSSMDRRRWKRDAAFAGSRRAAAAFGVASGYAGRLWSALPKGLRRLAGDGGFNGLVAALRGAEDGFAAGFWRDGFAYSSGGLGFGDYEDGGLELLLAEDGCLRVFGLEGLPRMLSGAVAWSGKRCFANRVTDFSRIFVPQGDLFDRGEHVLTCAADGLRCRVWMQVVEVTAARTVVRDGVYGVARKAGFVSGWMDLATAGMEFRAPVLDCAGPAVVFAGVEVAQKRGRHWVRLPFCCGVSAWGMDLVDDSPQQAAAALVRLVTRLDWRFARGRVLDGGGVRAGVFLLDGS